MRCECDSPRLHKVPRDHCSVFTTPTATAPWRTVLTCAITHEASDPTLLWPNFSRISETSPVALASDFYLYQYVIQASGILRIPPHLVSEFVESGMATERYGAVVLAQQAQSSLELEWGPIYRDYLHYAIVCELTHHGPFVDTFGDSPTSAYCGWSKLTNKVGRVQAAQYARECFLQTWRTNVHGGKRWADTAQVLAWAEQGEIEGYKFDNHIFLDRLFSLEHNTGSVFNKGMWTDVHLMSEVLDSHHNSDIDNLFRYARSEAQTIYLGFKELR